jgi:hypothetical protein
MEFKHQKDLGPDDIQKWCEDLDRKSKIEINDTQRRLLSIFKMNHEIVGNFLNAHKELSSQFDYTSFLINLIEKNFTFKIDYPSALIMSTLIDRPAIAVMYAYFLQYKCFQYKVKEVNIETLKDIFLWEGVFSEEVMHEMWDRQKFISNDRQLLNMLDYPQYMESIRNIDTEDSEGKNHNRISYKLRISWNRLIEEITRFFK